MDFIKGSTTIDKLPTNSKPELLDKIDTIIIVDGLEKGFICSMETKPIFVGYKNLGLPGNVFKEYCLFLNKDYCIFEYNNEDIVCDIRNNGNIYITDVYTKPYIDTSLNDDVIVLNTNDVGSITIFGSNLDGYLNISTGDNLDILNITNVKKDSIDIEYITSNIETTSPLIIKRGDVESYGKTIYIKTTNIISGIGLPGLFTTSFINGGSGNVLWGLYWDLKIYGKIKSVDEFFKSSNYGTPSQGTGPISPSVFTNSKYYAFTERSGSNYGSGQYATATTSNFAIIDSIEFEYHFAGKSFLDIRLKGYNVKNMAWVDLWVLNSTGVHSQSDNASKVILSDIDPIYDKLMFYFGESSSWSGDFALGYINIISK